MFGFVNVVGATLRETTRTVGGSPAGKGQTAKPQVKRSRASA
ncbi:hypothetical protein [uncultured Roseibium sp.]|nr:hypothetical protein [uncultured Roseibium sp.]